MHFHASIAIFLGFIFSFTKLYQRFKLSKDPSRCSTEQGYVQVVLRENLNEEIKVNFIVHMLHLIRFASRLILR